MYFAAQADLEDCVTLSKTLLKRSLAFSCTIECKIGCMPLLLCRHPHMRISSRLTDAHVYLMRRWVLDYLAENKLRWDFNDIFCVYMVCVCVCRSISSIKGELIPHLVSHQWMQADSSNTAVSATRHGGPSLFMMAASRRVFI